MDDNQEPNNSNSDDNAQVVQQPEVIQPTKPSPEVIKPTTTAPSTVSPSHDLSQPTPVTSSSPPPPVTTRGKPHKMNHKLIMILVGLLVFMFGIGAGVLLQAKVLDEPSMIERVTEAQMVEYYGVDYEQQIMEELKDAEDDRDRAQDLERTTDINAMHTHLEVYYNDYGYYPSEDIFRSEDVVRDEFPGLDLETLKDPEGRHINTSGSDYTYSAFECNGSECESYEISSTLWQSDETVYTKKSLN